VDDSELERSRIALSRREIARVGIAAASALGSASSLGQTPQPSGGATRRDIMSILDFGADASGRNDSSAAFRRALAELAGSELVIPPGRYLVERLGGLGPAGQKVVGRSRWNTVLASEAGGGPIFGNEVAARSTSAYHLISDLTIDLNGNDAIGIDLASVNCSTVQRVHFRGRPGVRRGTGLRFAAPLDKGAYDNAVTDCSFEDLAIGIQWGSGANNNSVFNSRIINCGVGYHASPAGTVDTPRVFGGRVEGCDIGLLEGSDCGAYFAVRFEDSAIADIRFTENSVNAAIWGGYTATTRTAILDLEKAISPSIDASDLGQIAVEESDARPKISTGRHVFAKAGKAPRLLPQRDFAVQFDDYALFRNQVGLEFATAAGAGSIVGMTTTAGDTLSIPGFDRAKKAYTTIEFGGGPAIRPLGDGQTDIGAPGRQYRSAHLSDGVHVAGRRVVGPRQPAIADDTSGSVSATRINQILAALRRHGLIDG
jgi:hypothetical protein